MLAAGTGGLAVLALFTLWESRTTHVSGMDLGLITGACVAIGGCVIALAVLPRARRSGLTPEAQNHPAA